MWVCGYAGEPLSQFVVRDAALRMKHQQLLDRFKGYNPAAGMRPNLWLKEDGSGGLAALETKWDQKVQLQQAGQGGSNTGSHHSQRHEHSEWEPPAWLRSSFTREAQANHRVQQQASQGDVIIIIIIFLQTNCLERLPSGQNSKKQKRT